MPKIKVYGTEYPITIQVLQGKYYAGVAFATTTWTVGGYEDQRTAVLKLQKLLIKHMRMLHGNVSVTNEDIEVTEY